MNVSDSSIEKSSPHSLPDRQHYTFEYAEKDLSRFTHHIALSQPTTHPILLIGPMGSGKTTFVRSLMRYFGVYDVSSPTFSMMQDYSSSVGTIYHSDLCKIGDHYHARLGIEEIIGHYPCLVEWPQSWMLDAYRKNALKLSWQDIRSPHTRTVSLSYDPFYWPKINKNHLCPPIPLL